MLLRGMTGEFIMKKMSDELTNDEIKKNISNMINRFESAKEKTDEYIANKINISRSTVTEWRNKKMLPKIYLHY